MTDAHNTQPDNEHSGEQPEHGPEVSITINGTAYTVHRGRNTVASLKALASIAQTYELDEIVNGQLQPLADDASVTITGGETFVSNLKVGQSS